MQDGAFDTAFTILSALLALVFVLFLAYITIKWMGRRMSAQAGGRVIKIIDRVMIGQDKCLLVLSVGGQTMLVGMTGDAVTKLADLPDLTQQPADGIATPPEFYDVLSDAVKKGMGRLSKRGGNAE